jgi:flagellar biosynthesis/type III secretory pathway protein FliH
MSCDICGKNNCERAFHAVQMQQAYDDAINSDKSNLLSEIAALREQLKDCSAAFDRQQEQLDRNAAPSDTRNYYADGYEAGYQAGMAEKKPWAGLTDEEFHDLQIEHGDDPWANFKAIEAKLKEQNT